jgi:hypothetical protein
MWFENDNDRNDKRYRMVPFIRYYNPTDEMNGTLLIDDYMAERFEAMAPYRSAMSTATPRQLSGNFSKTKPWLSTAANFIEAAPNIPPDPEILHRMMTMIPDAA